MKNMLFILLFALVACAHHGGKKDHDCSCDKKAEVKPVAVEFDGNCAQGLCLKGAKVKCDPTITAILKGKSYCFSSEKARADFMDNAEVNVKKAHESWGSIMGGSPRG